MAYTNLGDIRGRYDVGYNEETHTVRYRPAPWMRYRYVKDKNRSSVGFCLRFYDYGHKKLLFDDFSLLERKVRMVSDTEFLFDNSGKTVQEWVKEKFTWSYRILSPRVIPSTLPPGCVDNGDGSYTVMHPNDIIRFFIKDGIVYKEYYNIYQEFASSYFNHQAILKDYLKKLTIGGSVTPKRYKLVVVEWMYKRIAPELYVHVIDTVFERLNSHMINNKLNLNDVIKNQVFPLFRSQGYVYDWYYSNILGY